MIKKIIHFDNYRWLPRITKEYCNPAWDFRMPSVISRITQRSNFNSRKFCVTLCDLSKCGCELIYETNWSWKINNESQWQSGKMTLTAKQFSDEVGRAHFWKLCSSASLPLRHPESITWSIYIPPLMRDRKLHFAYIYICTLYNWSQLFQVPRNISWFII